MPIIPYISDDDKNLETIYHLAGDIGVDYVLPGTLYLRGKTRTNFFNVLKNKDTDLYYLLLDTYQQRLSKEYKSALYQRINNYKKKYNINSNYIQNIKQYYNKNPIKKP